MKKAILFLFLLSSVALFAQDFGLEIGIEDKGMQTVIGDEGFVNDFYLFIQLDFVYSFSILELFGSVQTNIYKHPNNHYTFIPVQSKYTVGARLNFGLITLQAEHMCSHPVAPDGKMNVKQYTYYDEYLRRISLRIDL
jgi:hypothetical protein